MRKIISIKTFEYYLICILDDGNTYKYDMSFVLQRTGDMVLPLRDFNFFKKIFIESGSLAWPNGYDIHANTVARDGQKVSNEIAS
jgi:hypothetical protein